MADLDSPHFRDAEAARTYLEGIRWPEGPVCPHCGSVERIYPIEGKGGKKGTKARPGLYKCGGCDEQFTVTVGTVFERSKIPLHKWLLATHLLCASKKGMSSHQLHRMLGVTYKTAWFMSHRIREAMLQTHDGPMGGGAGIFEADETYVGGKRRRPHRVPDARHVPKSGDAKRPKRWGGYGHDKEKVLSLVERGGKVRSFHMDWITAKTLREHLWAHLPLTAKLMTDEASYYKSAGKRFKSHESVNHSRGEYVRGDAFTNTVENYFSIFKRGLNGIYQHVGSPHLKRYLAEFDFRYNTRTVKDAERTVEALKGIEGKRLLYRQPACA